MGHEIELKFEVPASAFARLRRSHLMKALPQSATSSLVNSVYFDTRSRKLRHNRLSLRVREAGDKHIQGIKSYAGVAGLSEREEWEREIDGKIFDPQAMRGTPAEKLVTKKTQRKLKPVFETRVRRTTVPILIGKSHIELTLDQGQVRSGRKSRPIREVELELKDGSPTALFDAARRLTRIVPASLALESKADQGYALLDKPRARHFEKIHLDPDMTTEDALKTIAAACVKHFTSNVSAVLDGDSEGIHQMRVGLRRLRAAMSLFRDLLGDTESESIKSELKWLSSQLGPARDIDVFMHSEIVAEQAKKLRKEGAAAFKRQLAHTRSEAFDRAKAAVRSPRYRTITLDTVAWIETGRWTKSNNDLKVSLRARPISILAGGILSRRMKKISKKAKKLESLDAQRRHRLRIAIKKLRYAADFFGKIYSGKKARKHHAAFELVLEDLQDCLGKLNDISVHQRLSQRVAKIGSRKMPQQLFAAGIIAGQEQCDMTPALKEATKAASRLIRQPPFWPKT